MACAEGTEGREGWNRVSTVLDIFSFVRNLNISIVVPVLLAVLNYYFNTNFNGDLHTNLAINVNFVNLGLIVGDLLKAALTPTTSSVITHFNLSLAAISIN